MLPKPRSDRPLCKRTRINPIEVAGAKMRRNTDVPVRKDFTGCRNPDPNIYFRSATARHRSVFASASPTPLAMTRWSASASGNQSGVYAIARTRVCAPVTRGEAEVRFGLSAGRPIPELP